MRPLAFSGIHESGQGINLLFTFSAQTLLL